MQYQDTHPHDDSLPNSWCYNSITLVRPLSVDRFLRIRREQMSSLSSRTGKKELSSLTLILEKDMESLILKTISRHMKNKKVPRYSKHGFKKKKSCLINPLY